jgi:MarR family transcriptional regulator, lower aerobic nicotinate degradation pathway regulator
MADLDRISDKATWLLSRANARAHAVLAEALAAEGVRGYHVRILAALDQHGPSSQADLAARTGIDRSDVVATLDELAASGLAARTRDPHDARRNVVTLTDDGRRELERLLGVVDEVQERVLEPLSPAERRSLLRLLRKLG